MNNARKKRLIPAVWLILLVLSAGPAVYLNTLFGYLPVLTLGFGGLLSLLYAALLRHFLTVEGMEYELLAYDRRGERRRWTPVDLTAFGQTVGELPPISSSTGPDALELLREEGRSLYGLPNLAVCTARLSGELVQLLLDLRGRGRLPLVFFVLPAGVDERVRQEALRPRALLDAAGIPCYVLSGTEDLERRRWG